MEQNYSFIQQLSAQSRFWIQTVKAIGADYAGPWTNITPVIATNRIGLEEVRPSEENGGQSSSLRFYGSSFLTDETGDILTKAGREEETILLATYDLDKGARERLDWGLLETVDRICISRL